jgi:transcription initiation factor TFIID subunit TAF12
MKLVKLAIFALLVTFTACNSSNETEQLYDALVKGHDEVMPKSMAISSIRESMMKAVENASEEKKNQALDISTRLLKAEDQMNVWMVEFGEAINGKDEAKATAYKKLNEEIIQLKADTDSAIADAKALTAEFQ